MVDDTKPWAGLGDVKVQDTPPPVIESKPWGGLNMDDVVQVQDTPPSLVEIDDAVARGTEGALENMQSGARYTPAPSNTFTGWIGRAGRNSLLGGFSDTISAEIMTSFPTWAGGSEKWQAAGVTREEAIRAIGEGYDKDRALSADIVGIIATGGVAVRGAMWGKQGLAWAAKKAGISRGATTWALKHPKLGRLIYASGVGAGAGAIEEGIRSAVDETADLAVGEDFNVTDVENAVINGAVVGAVAGLALAPIEAVGRSAWNWFKTSIAGLSDAQATQGTKLIAEAIRGASETPEEALKRVGMDVQAFREVNGRMPAMSEVMDSRAVNEVTDVIRYYSGLGDVAEKGGIDVVMDAIKSFDDAIRDGVRLKGPYALRAQVDSLFDSVMTRFGKTPVSVSDEAIESLSRNKGWLQENAKWNPAARSILRVVDATDNANALRARASALTSKVNVADARAEVAGLVEDLAKMTDDAFNAGAVAPSEIAALRNLINLKDSMTRRMAAMDASEMATFNLDKFMPELRQADAILENYVTNGLKVTLRDANHLRAAASKAAFTEQDQAKREIARLINRTVSGIGVDEVPLYGKVRDLYSKALTRSESQEIGAGALRGTMRPDDIDVMLTHGMRPNQSRIAEGNAVAHRQGAEEGVQLAAAASAGGTPTQAVTAARGIVESPGIRQAIGIAAPRRSAMIKAAAVQLDKAVANVKTMLNKRSPTELAEEVAGIRDAALAGVFGHMGGAAQAGWLARNIMRFKIPRGTANKLVEMLNDPAQTEKALMFMGRKGIDLPALFGAFSAEFSQTEVN